MRIRHHGGDSLPSMCTNVASCTTNHVSRIRLRPIQHRFSTCCTASPRQHGLVGQKDKNYTKLRLAACYSSASHSSAVKNVAVLGGGITGLATAHYLSKEFKDAKITLYESKDTLGGWMRSKVMDVGNGKVIFESGPRSLRPQPPNGTLSLRLVGNLLGTALRCADAGSKFRHKSLVSVTMSSRLPKPPLPLRIASYSTRTTW